MSAVILALLESPACAPATLRAAAQAAQLMRARKINVLAIRAPAKTAKLESPDSNGPATAVERARTLQLRTAYQAWSAATPEAQGVPTEWVEVEGEAAAVLGEWGSHADLIVLQRPGERDAERRPVQTALFDARKPVLVVPRQADATQFGRRIAVAWRNDARTSAALRSALQWLGAGTEIHVISGAKRWETPPALPQLFADSGVSAHLHILPMTGQRSFGEALLARAHELDVDLLVLGAFAHPMLFGPILGGVTRHMLANADLPVLMRY
jgi:nucleotide-binding universal stress UspA family protein